MAPDILSVVPVIAAVLLTPLTVSAPELAVIEPPDQSPPAAPLTPAAVMTAVLLTPAAHTVEAPVTAPVTASVEAPVTAPDA